MIMSQTLCILHEVKYFCYLSNSIILECHTSTSGFYLVSGFLSVCTEACSELKVKTNIGVPAQTLKTTQYEPSQHSQFALTQRDPQFKRTLSSMPLSEGPQAIAVMQGDTSSPGHIHTFVDASRASENPQQCYRINTQPNTLSLAAFCNSNSLLCSINLGLLHGWQTYLSSACLFQSLMRLESSNTEETNDD